MSENPQVTIPDEAWDAVVEACPIKDVVAAKRSAWDINDLQQKAVEAAAPLIVAAELERLAPLWDGGTAMPPVSGTYVARQLRARAAQLRGEDTWCNCQAVRGTANYPGPWHPKGDSVGCLRFGQPS